MGQFSWISRNGDQIRCEHHAGQRVWMVFKSDDNSKVVVREDRYEGYGIFAGLDYFEVLARMNGQKTRDEGITEYFTYCEYNYVEFPQLFTSEPSQLEIDRIDWTVPNPNDPNQGWVVRYDDEIECEY